ncbi:hypothetical protein [Brevundimonas sp.]|uniref:hypothetical protein n=1 Tax=Brevundimonas sp. TaxID=1871086 RepID=UPI00289ACADB|nr:hypothetical protein [Brevundimonas sp.]
MRGSGQSNPVVIVSVVIATIAATLAPAAWAMTRPAHPFQVAAVFPPWWSRQRMDDAVGETGAISAYGGVGAIAVVHGGTDLPQRLRRAGAWLILDPEAAVLCGADFS